MMRASRHGESEPASGERLERRRRSRKAWIIGGVFAMGLVTGFLVGMREADDLFGGGSQGWPPAMAIAVALSYVLSVVGGGLVLARQTDEFELQRQYKAVAAAALVYVLVYPVWFVLWMGGLVREPLHAALFVLFWLSLAGASLFYRFR